MPTYPSTVEYDAAKIALRDRLAELLFEPLDEVTVTLTSELTVIGRQPSLATIIGTVSADENGEFPPDTHIFVMDVLDRPGYVYRIPVGWIASVERS